MIKVKDGYAKLIGTTYSGSADRVLLSNGGDKAVSDFAAASGVVTALGTNGSYITWTKNGTANNLTVPYSYISGGLIGILSTSSLPSNTLDAGYIKYYFNIHSGTEGLFNHINNANGILSISRHSGNYLSQLGFSSDRRLYFRSADGDDINSSTWNTLAYVSEIPTSLPANGGNSDTVDNLHAGDFTRFYLSPMTSDAPADSAKSWFINTMPSGSGAIVYNVTGSEKTIIAGKSTGSYGHMLQLNYTDNYLRMLRCYNGTWKTTDWEKISAGYADSAGYASNTDKLDNIDSTGFLRNYSQNYDSTISSTTDISPTLTAGVARVHIANIEYSSVLTGYDFNNKAWQLRFRPTYNDGIYFRSQGTGTSWKKLAFTSDIPSIPTSLPANGGTATYYTSGPSATFTNVWDCNTPDRIVYSEYGSSGRSVANAPAGWQYGTLLELGHMNYRGQNGDLNLQLMWDVAHATTNGGTLWFRGSCEKYKWAKTWCKVLSDQNYTTYTVKKDGTGASGTWGINITGSAGSIAWGNVIGKPIFAIVATSGSYDDLTNKPTIPSVGNGTVTIKQAGNTIGSFTMNQSSDATIELTDANTNYYPTTFSWTAGSTAGPTGSLTGSGMSAVSFGAIPSASSTASGIVTTGAQYFAGQKTFYSGLIVYSTNKAYFNYSSTYAGNSNYVTGSSTTNLSLNGYSTMSFAIAGSTKLNLTSSSLNPQTSGDITLGTTSLKFGNVYAASIGTSSYRCTYGYFSNAVYAASGFYESSDERLKNILNPVKVDLDELSKLRKVYYIWKDASNISVQLGMIAQDVQKLYPELVDVDKETGYLSLAYDKLSVIALEAIDNIYNTIKDLKKENLELKSRIEKLEKLL